MHNGRVSRGRVSGCGFFVSDRSQVTCNMWHMPHDMWHMTCDKWHMKKDINKIVFLSVCFGIGSTICTKQEIQCLPYARFFLNPWWGRPVGGKIIFLTILCLCIYFKNKKGGEHICRCQQYLIFVILITEINLRLLIERYFFRIHCIYFARGICSTINVFCDKIELYSNCHSLLK